MPVHPKSHFFLLSKAKSFVTSLLCLSLSLNGYADSEPNNRNDTTIQLAEITSQWGQLTRSHSSGEAAKTLAAQQFSSAVTSTLTPWLNQYGNARFTLPFDSRFSLKGISFDWLLPWYNVTSSTAFSQFGVKTDHRQTTTSVGFGYRYLTDNWLWGANAFWDALWPEQYHRYGIGTEAWHDNVKLSANLYQRLSGWKTSRQVSDYDARPANGWDIRVEGGLPALPHWGGQVMFEQYYGQQVGLFGDNKRQHNPYSLTAGLTYTPVPLVTLGADVRQGKQDHRDNRFTLALNYQLGVPLAQQLDPNAVAPLRSLTFRRTDFVNRNHNMVLDYRKQTLITLDFPAQLKGDAGKIITFTPRITSKYLLARLELRADELQQAGGRIVHQTPDKIMLLLPKAIDKVIRLSGIAIDKHGNRSRPSETTLFIQPTEIHVQVTANRAQARADGQDSVMYTVMVKDRDGKPVPDQTVSWSSDKGKLSQTTQKTDAQGLAAVLLSSHHHGEHSVQVSVGDNVTVALPVHFSAVLKPVITTDKTQARADGKDAVTFTVTVKDAAGIPVPHQSVKWQTSRGKFLTLPSTTNKHGQATAALVSLPSGIAEVSVMAGEETFTASPVEFLPALTHTLTCDKSTAIADGQDSALCTIDVRDAADQPMVGREIVWSTDHGQIGDEQVITDSRGKARARVISRKAGVARVRADMSGTIITAGGVTFERQLKSVIIADKTHANGNGQEAIVLTAIVEDILGLPVENQAVIWHTDNGILSSAETRTDSQGLTQIQLTSTVAGAHRVWIQVDDKTVTAPTLWFDDVLTSTLRADKTRMIANGQDSVILTVTVKNLTGQPAVGIPVWWRSDNGHFTDAQIETDENGEARATLRSQKAGTASVTTIIDDQEVISPTVEFIPLLRIADTVAVDSQGGNANQKAFGTRGPSVFWRGAKFRIIIADNTGRVNWQSDSPAVTVSGDTVVVQQRPDGVRLTGTDEAEQQVVLTLTSDTWFERSGITKDFYFNATQICQSLGSQIAPKYALERLYEEWGNFYHYEGWVREFYVVSTDYLSASSGSMDAQTKWAFWAESDSWMRNAWHRLAFACGS
ncbi:putative invasin [Xenorhabdus bovienii str. Jollieti]|uniref:Putative invasin n=2 Tax=Xenorhabdus bovienii TaxID=40576 RepID=D3V083_XENBS|nr:inverse autotransporter beta domain-containing protein [Xenorhabdus bovienii]CBJ80635.1 putative invasin [Xenorhabdus bovienii SS-2004]CBJ82520.1 putative invasin [Xenorhabdus bovienii SS-2004]CDH30344.1 putative invasin [Xenorhabdus bovienii str. Jollieti]